MDKTCLIVLMIIILSDAVAFTFWVIHGHPSLYSISTSDSRYKPWMALDPTYLKHTCDNRSSRRVFDDTVSFLMSISYCALFVPIAQASWILSRGGTRRVFANVTLMLLAAAGCVGEFLSSMILAGARHIVHRYCSNPDQMGDWNLRHDAVMGGEVYTLTDDNGIRHWDVTGDAPEEDGVGWRVLEILYMMSAGLVTWVDAFEWLCMFGVFMILYFEVRNENRIAKEGEATFDKNWAKLGMGIGVLCIFRFFEQVLSFRSQSLMAVWQVFLSFLAVTMWMLIPIWLISLGSFLPKLRAAWRQRVGETMDLEEVTHMLDRVTADAANDNECVDEVQDEQVPNEREIFRIKIFKRTWAIYI